MRGWLLQNKGFQKPISGGRDGKKEAVARADEIRWAKLAANAAEETAARIRAAAEDEAQARTDANEAYAKRRALWEDNGGKSIAQAFREKIKTGFQVLMKPFKNATNTRRDGRGRQ